MIRREGNDPMHYTISRRGKKMATSQQNLSTIGLSNQISESPTSEVVSFIIKVWFTNVIIIVFFCYKVVGATEEVENEEMHDGMANVLTALGHQFVQTVGGNVVKIERDIDYDDNIIYRYN